MSNISDLPKDLPSGAVVILESRGFHWCKKDCRWETKKDFNSQEIRNITDFLVHSYDLKRI